MGDEPLELDAILADAMLEADPLRFVSMLCRSVRNSTASLLISSTISPELEYASAFLDTLDTTGVTGSLFDLEC